MIMIPNSLITVFTKHLKSSNELYAELKLLSYNLCEERLITSLFPMPDNLLIICRMLIERRIPFSVHFTEKIVAEFNGNT